MTALQNPYACNLCKHKCQIQETNRELKNDWKTILALALFAILTLIIIGIFNSSITPTDTIQLIILIVLAFTLINSSKGAKRTALYSELSFEMKRKENAMTLISDYNRLAKQSTDYAEIKNAFTKGGGKFEIIHHLNREKIKSLTTMINFFERLAICIETDWACEKILSESFKGMVVDCWDSFGEYLDDYRNSHENPRLFVKLEHLAKIWKRVN